MTRLFYVMIVAVAAMLLAAPAQAAVPWPPNCTVAFYNAIDDSAIGICPNGDWTYIDVTIRDQFNQPMNGQVVDATFTAPVVLGSVCTGLTNAVGFKRLRVKGGVNNAGPLLLTTVATVKIGAITIAVMPSMYVYSADYNASQYVDNSDYAIFGSHWHHSSTFPTP